jgi:orotidine-5'-phosphate decarboxylase
MIRKPLYAGVARMMEDVALDDLNRKSSFSHLGVVVGATNPKELQIVSEIAPSCWILAPGVGAQGGKIEDVLKIRPDKNRIEDKGILIPVSRAVLYASDKEDYLARAKEAVQALWEAQKM